MLQRLVLCIVDGFGIDDQDPFNPILKYMPWWNKTWKASQDKTLLKASGASVGLPEEQMGNSEVGHLTIGSGQIIEQDLVRVGRCIKEQFATHPLIQKLIKDRTRTHLIGVFSEGGVHAHKDHYMAIFHHLKPHVPVVCHLITDGRDTKPSIFTEQYEAELEPYVATVMGRYYAMDRDKRWDRTQKAYDAMVRGEGYPLQDVLSYVRGQHNTDEFIEPGVKEGYQGIQNGDAVIVVNFRADRIVQILSLLSQCCHPGASEDPLCCSKTDPHFRKDDKRLHLLTLSDLPIIIPGVTTLFPKSPVHNTLGEIISKKGLTQLRVAETEKYAHVTYFFNGGKDKPFEGEDRILIPSPKVSTYDQAPEMSAAGVTDAVLKGIDKQYDVIIVNYANADMVGHTGNYEAVSQALTYLDQQLERLYSACIQESYTLIITSDHGNVENMIDGDRTVNTAHSTNPVPFLVLNAVETFDLSKLTQLSDIAGFVLEGKAL